MNQRDGTQLDFWLAVRGPLGFSVLAMDEEERSLAWFVGLLVVVVAVVLAGKYLTDWTVFGP